MQEDLEEKRPFPGLRRLLQPKSTPFFKQRDPLRGGPALIPMDGNMQAQPYSILDVQRDVGVGVSKGFSA